MVKSAVKPLMHNYYLMMEVSMDVHTLFGFFDCYFNPTYSMSPAEPERYIVGFVAHVAGTPEPDKPELTGHCVDILGASTLENFFFEETLSLRLHFYKKGVPESYHTGGNILYTLNSETGWQKFSKAKDDNNSRYAMFEGGYKTAEGTTGRVVLVAFNYQPHIFFYRKMFRDVLGFQGNFANARDYLSRAI